MYVIEVFVIADKVRPLGGTFVRRPHSGRTARSQESGAQRSDLDGFGRYNGKRAATKRTQKRMRFAILRLGGATDFGAIQHEATDEFNLLRRLFYILR